MSQKNPHGIRTRINGRIIELWLGTPGDVESDLLAAFGEEYLDGVMNQLSEIHKAPKQPYNNRVYGLPGSRRK